MKPLEVILDTNQLPLVDLKNLSRDFENLLQLSRDGLIRISLPQVVYFEWLNNLFTNRNKSLKDLFRNIGGIKNTLESEVIRSLFSKSFQAIATVKMAPKEELEKKLKEQTEKELNAFISAKSIEILASQANHIAKAFNDKINSSCVFEDTHDKVHFVDSLISQVLKDRATESDIHFICEDKNLSKASGKLPKVTNYKDLRHFLDEASKLAPTFSDSWRSFEDLEGFIANNLTEIEEHIVNQVLAAMDDLKPLVGMAYGWIFAINESEITKEDLFIDTSEAKYLYYSWFSLPFQISISFNVDTFVSVSEDIDVPKTIVHEDIIEGYVNIQLLKTNAGIKIKNIEITEMGLKYAPAMNERIYS